MPTASFTAAKNIKGRKPTDPNAPSQLHNVANNSMQPLVAGYVSFSAADWATLGGSADLTTFPIFAATRQCVKQQLFTTSDMGSNITSRPSGSYLCFIAPNSSNFDMMGTQWDYTQMQVNGNKDSVSGVVAVVNLWACTGLDGLDGDPTFSPGQIADVSFVWTLDNSATPQILYPSSDPNIYAGALPAGSAVYFSASAKSSIYSGAINNQVVGSLADATYVTSLLKTKSTVAPYYSATPGGVIAKATANTAETMKYALAPAIDLPLSLPQNVNYLPKPALAVIFGSTPMKGGSDFTIVDCGGQQGARSCPSGGPPVTAPGTGSNDTIPIILMNNTGSTLYVYVDTQTLGGYIPGQRQQKLGKTTIGANCPSQNPSNGYAQGYSYPKNISSATPLLTSYEDGLTYAQPWSALPSIDTDGNIIPAALDVTSTLLEMADGAFSPPITVNSFWYISSSSAHATASFMTLQNQVNEAGASTFDYNGTVYDCTSTQGTRVVGQDMAAMGVEYEILLQYAPTAGDPSYIKVSGGPTTQSAGAVYCDPVDGRLNNPACDVSPNTICYGLDTVGGPSTSEFGKDTKVKGWCGPPIIYDDIVSQYVVYNKMPFDVTVAMEMPSGNIEANINTQKRFSDIGVASSMQSDNLYSGAVVVKANSKSSVISWIGPSNYTIPTPSYPSGSFDGTFGPYAQIGVWVNEMKPTKDANWLPDAIASVSAWYTSDQRGTTKGTQSADQKIKVSGAKQLIRAISQSLKPSTADGDGTDGVITINIGGKTCENGCADCKQIATDPQYESCPPGTALCCGESGYCECLETSTGVCPGEVGGPVLSSGACISDMTKGCQSATSACTGAVIADAKGMCICQEYPHVPLGYNNTTGLMDESWVRGVVGISKNSLPPGKWFFVWAPVGGKIVNDVDICVIADVPIQGITFAQPDFMGLPIDIYAYSVDAYDKHQKLGILPVTYNGELGHDNHSFLVATNVVVPTSSSTTNKLSKAVLFNGTDGRNKTQKLQELQKLHKRQKRNKTTLIVVASVLGALLLTGGIIALAIYLWRRQRGVGGGEV
jgi:hypothetical protein